MSVGADFATLDVLVERVFREKVLGSRLVTEVHCTEVLRGVIDGTPHQYKLTVEAEQRRIAQLAKKRQSSNTVPTQP